MARDSIEISSRGNYAYFLHALRQMQNMDTRSILDKYAKICLRKLQEGTPTDTGVTKDSWYYNISGVPGSYQIEFCNSNVSEGTFHIALFLEYGHATKNGGWVEGRKYITPALEETFDALCKELEISLRRY